MAYADTLRQKLNITALNTTLDDGQGDGWARTRTDIAEDIADAINEHNGGGASAKVWRQYNDDDGQIYVYLNGGSTKGYGRVVVRDDGSFRGETHRTGGTNIVDIILALGGEGGA